MDKIKYDFSLRLMVNSEKGRCKTPSSSIVNINPELVLLMEHSALNGFVIIPL
jgi:hypothetical protein